MTAGFGVPVAATFSEIDPDECARNYKQDKDDGQIRASNRAEAIAQLIAQFNVLAAKTPQVLFCKMIVAPLMGGDNWMFRWCHPDWFKNASEHEFRVLSRLRSTDPTTGDGYWVRLDSSMAEDANCKGGEYASEAPSWYDISQVFGESAITARSGATRAPADAVVEEGVLCNNNHLMLGLVVQDVPLSALDIEDHCYVAQKPEAGDRVLANFGETLRSRLHEVRSENLPIVLRWAAVGDGTAFNSVPASGDAATQYGIRVETTDTYINLLAPSISNASGFETYSNVTPGCLAHQYLCGVGNESIANCAKVPVDCYVLAQSINANATVRFETSLGNTEITITNSSGLDWFGGTTVYLNSAVDNDDTTASRHKVDICGKAGTNGVLNVYGWMGHVTYP